MNLSSKIVIVLILALGALRCEEKSSELILFSSSRSDNSDIYLMQPDGSNVQQLTTTASEEWAPTWKNRNEISFLRQTEKEIIRVSLDLRSKEETILPHPSECVLDDKNALFDAANRTALYPCSGDIFIHYEDGTSFNVTADLEGTANYPAYAFQGSHVLFTSDHTGSNDLYLFELAKKQLTALTTDSANSERGDISSNGKWLVYSSDQYEKGNQDLVLLNLETQELERLTDSPSYELIARWSNDNRTLYYGGFQENNWEIYSINTLTKETIRLTNVEGFDGDPRIYRGR